MNDLEWKSIALKEGKIFGVKLRWTIIYDTANVIQLANQNNEFCAW